MNEVKVRRRGSRISSKHQVTLPVEALAGAGLREGERVSITALGPGRVLIERQSSVVDEFAGRLTGVYREGTLDELRNEWD